ncbi:hypothetical protein L2E82_43272 [Cichorium intybus]|uniref:Uncharacterized protein n=1 Tax=Cichorium intybus TaxID=13427 RepID=A0ACB8ZPD5_CICIN|nr:hypothetical protein L2E82_43272 [Cichorium intybus]
MWESLMLVLVALIKKLVLPLKSSIQARAHATEFMLPDPDNAIIWRGPRKNKIIKQFLKDVYWGELDFLVVNDHQSSEHMQFLKETGTDGAIIVTIQQ